MGCSHWETLESICIGAFRFHPCIQLSHRFVISICSKDGLSPSLSLHQRSASIHDRDGCPERYKNVYGILKLDSRPGNLAEPIWGTPSFRSVFQSVKLLMQIACPVHEPYTKTHSRSYHDYVCTCVAGHSRKHKVVQTCSQVCFSKSILRNPVLCGRGDPVWCSPHRQLCRQLRFIVLNV